MKSFVQSMNALATHYLVQEGVSTSISQPSSNIENKRTSIVVLRLHLKPMQVLREFHYMHFNRLHQSSSVLKNLMWYYEHYSFVCIIGVQ
jgi:hypothetical protein